MGLENRCRSTGTNGAREEIRIYGDILGLENRSTGTIVGLENRSAGTIVGLENRSTRTTVGSGK